MTATRNELVDRYEAGERNFRGLDLDGETLDLRGSNLTGADFSGSFIFADFRGANLECCVFERANVKTCDFRGANLRGASFREAAVDAADFSGAEMAGACFDGASAFGHIFHSGESPGAVRQVR